MDETYAISAQIDNLRLFAQFILTLYIFHVFANLVSSRSFTAFFATSFIAYLLRRTTTVARSVFVLETHGDLEDTD